MRILLISNWLPPVISGSAYYAGSLAQALQARGHEIIGVTLDWGEEGRPETDPPYPVFRLPVLRVPKLPIFYNLKLMGFAFTPGNQRRLERLIHEHRPDLIHLVNHIFDTNFLATRAARSTGIPIVGSITTPIQHQNPWVQAVFGAADRLLVGRFGVSRWNGIISLDWTVHRYVGEVYGREVQKRSVMIPLGARLEAMTAYGNGLPQRTGQPQILMVGHIHPFRNPTQLVRAMPHVLKKIPNARLVLAGRVEIQEPVRAARSLGLNEDQVQFLGETKHEKTIELMKHSHLFATWVTGPYPSLGTAPMEAMLCQTPVISDLPENLFGEGKLKNRENIVLTDSKDPRAVAEAVLGLLGDEGRRQKIGAAGRRFVLEHLNWGRIAEETEEFYEQILKRKSSPIMEPEKV